MSQWIKEVLKFLLGTGIAVFFLYITLNDRPLLDIFEDIKDVKLGYVALAGFFLLCSHIFRTLRWQMLLKEAGNNVSFINTLNSVLICYGVNAVTPRLGEIARCSTLYKSEKVPISNSLGTVIVERVADLIVLGLGVGIIGILEFNQISELLVNVFKQISSLFGSTQVWIGLGIMTLAGVIGLWILKNTKVRSKGGKLGQKVFDFLDGLMHSAKSVLKLKHPGLFIFHTFMLWAFLVVLTYAFFLALPETENLSFFFAAVVFFIGGMGWVLPVPNGMGPFHYVVWQVFLAYGLSGQAGKDFAIVDNGGTWIVTLILGAFSYLLFWILNFTSKKKEEVKG